ncbi:cytochrome P450- family 72- subfamily A-polypeptide 7 [Striga hermonthica]|uniref:Cytochrome P450- family 72- subfamily A-polypeptide 7 n=1 Tax=Striga hermonthica TaxID=68872 RepID=A0A9N7MHI0_STRHE|nr:cytochrome P450- family 72- subfamily A-polypeptide 7 [Striga hermonthica]
MLKYNDYYYYCVNIASWVLGLAAAVVWLWKIVRWAWVEPRRMEAFLRKQGLRGNPYTFLFGDANEIAHLYRQANAEPIDPSDDIVPRVMPFIKKTIQTYGKNAFAWIGPRARIIISEPELMRIVLNKHKTYQKNFRVSNKIIRLVVGGLVYYEGDEWKRSRMKLNPAFHLEKLKQMVPAMQSCTENILNQWKSKIGGDGTCVVDVLHYLEDYSGTMVSKSLFHATYNDEMRRNFHYLRDLTIMTDTASKPLNFPGSEYFPSKTKRRAKEMEKEVRRSFTQMIEQRLRDRRRSSSRGPNEGADLLDFILDELYELERRNSRVSNNKRKIMEEAIAQTKLFYFAGFDTTSNLLVWTMITLAIHHNWQARAREEVLQVLGQNKALTHHDLNELKIVNMILLEVLRLYPPVMELSRVVEEETQLGNLRIPKGVLLQLPIAMLHRDPQIWGEDALEFRPDRFAEGSLKAANGQAAFLPFSWGPRICIGQNFALLEGKAFVAHLLRTFSFELGPTYLHAPYAAFTVQPQFGAPLLLRKLY